MLQRAGRFWRGFSLPFRAAGFLWRTRGVKRFAVLPLVVNVLLYAVLIAVAFWAWDEVEIVHVDWRFWDPVGAWLAAGVNALSGALGWVLFLVVLLLGSYLTFTAVGMVVASPFNDILSERIERAICSPREAAGLPLRLTAAATAYSMLDSLWIVVRQVFFSILVLPLILIPLVGFAPLFCVGAYYAGLGFVDVGMARNLMRHRHKKPLLCARRWEIFGLGVAMQLLFMIPFLGLLFLPVGVTAGTLTYLDFDWDGAWREAGVEPPPGFVMPCRIGAETPPPA